MQNDVLGNFQLHWSEVPDGLNARAHHLIHHRLRHFRRSRDDTQMDTHPLGKIAELFEGQYLLLMDPAADFVGVGIKSSHDPQAEL